MADFPLQEVAEQANEHVEKGCTVYQKWTCDHCGSRQGMATPNTFYTSGSCEECRKVTQIAKCNYLLIMPLGKGHSSKGTNE